MGKLGKAVEEAAKVGEVAAKAGKRLIDELLRPGGVAIGKAGTDEWIRELAGGLDVMSG